MASSKLFSFFTLLFPHRNENFDTFLWLSAAPQLFSHGVGRTHPSGRGCRRSRERVAQVTGNVKNRWQSLTGQRKFIPLRIPFIILGLILAVRTLSAKDPPKPAPTPDPALDLNPAQDQQIQRINDLFAKNEGPLSDALKKARDEYKRAINAHPVDEELVSEKAAAARKAATLLATAQALHRANVLILLTPAQRRMVDTLEVTGKVPGTERDKKSTDQGH